MAHAWQAVSRTSGLALGYTLPITNLSAVTRHLGVDTAVLTTPYSAQSWSALAPASGVVLYRDGVQRFSGLVSSRQVTWDRTSGSAVIKVQAVGDVQQLADRLVMPDPLRAADDQTVSDYWTFTGTASAAMLRAISDQAGATCAASRQVTGLTTGADPGVGLSRTWTGLFDNLLTWLATTSVASGVNLGLRVTSSAGALTAGLVVPADNGVKFSVDLGNLVGFDYSETAPTVTNALVAGQGNLHLRTRKLSATTDPLATAWGRQVWSYIDRRDTSDVTELTKAGTDALAQGAQKTSLVCTLTDSQAATFGTDWDLGSKVTVYVGLPGQTRVATVTDVVREVQFTVTDNGVETIAPAIGTYDATAIVPTPTQSQLAEVGAALGKLIART